MNFFNDKKIQRKSWNNDSYLRLFQAHPVNEWLQPEYHSSDLKNVKPTEPLSENPQNHLSGQIYSAIVRKIGGNSIPFGEGKSDYEFWTPTHQDLFAQDWIVIK